ncbi:hypothetical protein PFISCL1PPCAC_4797, partial [Pristionchus fissidentatus]
SVDVSESSRISPKLTLSMEFLLRIILNSLAVSSLKVVVDVSEFTRFSSHLLSMSMVCLGVVRRSDQCCR